MQPSDSKAPAIAEDRAFVVYDTASGEIRHLHRVTVFAGATAPADRYEALALAAARQMRHPTENLKVLAIHPDELAASATRRVDPRTGRLVERAPEPGAPNRA